MKIFLAIATLALSTSLAQSATLTFDNVEPSNGFDWNEQGFYGYVENYDDQGVGEIHGDLGAKGSGATIARDALFSANSIDVTGIGGFNLGADFEYLEQRFAYDNLIFKGYLGNEQVASASLFTGTVWNSFTYFFSEAFAFITRLEILTPINIIGPGGEFCDDCLTIRFDNLEYRLVDAPSPVPLPASALFLGAGLTSIGAIRKLRNKNTRDLG